MSGGGFNGRFEGVSSITKATDHAEWRKSLIQKWIKYQINHKLIEVGREFMRGWEPFTRETQEVHGIRFKVFFAWKYIKIII
jgi:hypothetical protein